MTASLEVSRPDTPSSRPYLAIRGAITIEADTAALVSEATEALIATLIARNSLTTEDVLDAFFTATPDITSDFPARTARDVSGWHDVPMLCATEMSVAGAMPLCIRVMVHAMPRLPRAVHVYLRGAAALRPDLATAR
jgi:chorismate mutase